MKDVTKIRQSTGDKFAQCENYELAVLYMTYSRLAFGAEWVEPNDTVIDDFSKWASPASACGRRVGYRQWTAVYCDVHKCADPFYYVRLCPDFMDLEASGFPHGIALGCGHFKTEDEAKRASAVLNAFLESMAAQYAEGK